MGDCTCNGCVVCADLDADLYCDACWATEVASTVKDLELHSADIERHAVVLRLQERALAIRTLGKGYRWAAKILEDEADAIKEGKHRD